MKKKNIDIQMSWSPQHGDDQIADVCFSPDDDI